MIAGPPVGRSLAFHASELDESDFPFKKVSKILITEITPHPENRGGAGNIRHREGWCLMGTVDHSSSSVTSQFTIQPPKAGVQGDSVRQGGVNTHPDLRSGFPAQAAITGMLSSAGNVPSATSSAIECCGM